MRLSLDLSQHIDLGTWIRRADFIPAHINTVIVEQKVLTASKEFVWRILPAGINCLLLRAIEEEGVL